MTQLHTKLSCLDMHLRLQYLINEFNHMNTGIFMTTLNFSKPQLNELSKFFKKHPRSDLISSYVHFLEIKHKVSPVVFMPQKKIFINESDLFETLERENTLFRETNIVIKIGAKQVNERTKRIYICPFTGKVFGDNTHANPQDAIYDCVSKNAKSDTNSKELPVKKFYVSEDPEIIKNYIHDSKKTLTKKVYTSLITAKLYNSKEAIIQDCKENYIRPISFLKVTEQNRFTIDEDFLAFIQENLDESKVAEFVEALSACEGFEAQIKRWTQ